MQIDVTHRKLFSTLNENDYQDFVDKSRDKLKLINDVYSIILCGSLAKNDLVPGWSDIDLVVILKKGAVFNTLEKIKKIIQPLSLKYDIGIGLDIVLHGEFVKTKKFLGRPYMMTYEVAVYGQTIYGKDILKNISYDSLAKKNVEGERKLLIAAELHSWRRQYVLSNSIYSIDWLFSSTKCLLRILQCEIGPNRELPINSMRSLERYAEKYSKNKNYKAFQLANTIRFEWKEYLNKTNIKKEIDFLNKVIWSYSI